MEWPKQDTGLFAVPLCVFCALPGLLYRSRGGELYVQGIFSLDGIGNNVYRGYSISGSITQEIYASNEEGDILCFELLWSDTWTCSGSYMLYPSPSDPTGETMEVVDSVSCSGGGGGFCYNESWSETSYVWTGCGGCLTRTDGYNEHTVGTVTETASGLLSETDAISHLETYGAFSDWQDAPTHAAFGSRAYGVLHYEGFHFTYWDVEWKLVRPGLTPGVEYRCTVPVYRKDLSSWEDFAWYANQTVTAIADATGTATFSATVPNAQGYETYVEGEPIVEPVEP